MFTFSGTVLNGCSYAYITGKMREENQQKQL